MWVPDLEIKPAPVFVAILVALHLSVVWAIWLLSDIFLLLLPLLLLSCLVLIAKHGLLTLKRSVRRIWLTETGWFIRYQDQREEGPLTLTASSSLGHRFIRLSLKGKRVRHVLITPDMIGRDRFRKLQVFLRWAPDKQLAPES
ncbi:MAG: hypothetical protein D9N11_04775 [Ketobacter sp.]|nr:MAG: hypothetical protein D9N11_04775 [Ketobacter sp.]